MPAYPLLYRFLFHSTSDALACLEAEGSAVFQDILIHAQVGAEERYLGEGE